MPSVAENKIIDRFNDAVREVQKAFESSYQKDIGEAQKCLERSATAIYQVVEWVIKNVLLNKFNDPVLHKTEIDIIEAPGFFPKLDLFERAAIPLKTVKVDFKLIKDLKSPVRNQPEHSGFIPHYNSLRLVIVETEKIIISYLNKNAHLERLPEEIKSAIDNNTHWTELLNACESFVDGRNYVLVIGPNSGSSEMLEPLGLINWSLILDFDPQTEVSGFYKLASKRLELARKIHLLTNQESSTTFSPYKATYWVACNGIHGRSSTMTSNFKEWSFKYSPFLQKILPKCYATMGIRPTTVLVLWDNSQYVLEVCKSIYNSFAGSAEFVYATKNVLELSSVYDNYEGRAIELSISEVTEGILKIRNFINPSLKDDLITLPSKDEKYVSMSRNDVHWIEEDMELVHKNILDGVEFDQNKSEFLKGKQITWSGLQLNFDAGREMTPQIKRRIEKGLNERGTLLVTLSHYPGIGGTTLGRRLVWDFHNSYPVLNIRRYRSQETINRVYRIFEITKLPPLILADSSVVSYDEIERLLNEIKGRTFPVVILLIQRNEDSKQTKGAYYLPNVLTDLEFRTFVEFYINENPSKKNELNALVSSGSTKERHPFYLGLIAFEDQFYGLSDFVSKSLTDATDVQKKIVALISLSYIYAQQAFSAQLLSGLLMTDETRIIRLEKYLPGSLLHLLINTEETKWQPVHYLVGKELLNQVLSGGSSSKDVWRQNLPDISVELIQVLSTRSNVASDSDMELIRRLFIYRHNQEILGKEDSLFSNLVEEGLLSDEARLRIFRQLTESFPNESHFWGHLARFYNIKMHNNDEALAAVNKAIELAEEEDHLLFHMKGMCLRGKAYEVMNTWKGKKDCSQERLKEVIDLVEESGENFQRCRDLSQSNEHGFISHVQMIIQYIDFCYTISSYANRTDFLRNLGNWNRQQLDLAETLLDQVKRINRDDTDNIYIKKCDLKLEELYENYSLIIEGWNNLLSNKDASKPPIRRQIVRAYIKKAGSLGKVAEKDIEKMLSLIETNIQEEPKNENNIPLWFQCARQISLIDINTAIDKIANWRINSNSLDATYYLGILHVIQAIGNTTTSKIKAEQLIRETSERGRTLPNRTFCFEWLGQSNGLKSLTTHQDAVGRDENHELSFNSSILKLVSGKISNIKGPEAGHIELECGLTAFFVPAREGFVKNRDNNQNVNFHVGFSYDGIRAWNVKRI